MSGFLLVERFMSTKEPDTGGVRVTKRREFSGPGLWTVRVHRGPVNHCGSCAECTVAPKIHDEKLKANRSKGS